MKEVSSLSRSTPVTRPRAQERPVPTGLSMDEIEEKYTQAVRQDPDYPRFVSFEAFAKRYQAPDTKVEQEKAPQEPAPKDIEALYNEQVRADPDYPRFVSFEAFARRHKGQNSSENAPKTLTME